MCWRWFRRKKATKEKGAEEKQKDVIMGEIIETRHATRGILNEPVTLLVLKLEDGSIQRAVMPVHQTEPKAGNKLEVVLGKEFGNETRYSYEKQDDGSMKLVLERQSWLLIEEYKILA